MTAFDYELVLPKRVQPQPSPRIVECGDCGACVVAGLADMEVESVYELLDHEKRRTLDWHAMIEALDRSGAGEHIISRTPIWGVRPWRASMGPSGLQNWMAWADYIRMALSGGYYAITMVDVEERGIQDDTLWLETNHWQMICGIRYLTDGSQKREVLVSCSSSATPDQEWVSVKRFLAVRGGYNAILSRPVEGR